MSEVPLYSNGNEHNFTSGSHLQAVRCRAKSEQKRFVFHYLRTLVYLMIMTLGRCPLSIFCSRGTPPRVYHALSPDGQGQYLALTVLDEPCSLDSGAKQGKSSRFLSLPGKMKAN